MAVIFWMGCAGQKPRRAPEVPSAQQMEENRRKDLVAHLVGSWELPGKEGKIKKIIFGPSGQLTFKDGLEYFNPGAWDLDLDRQELTISLPDASDKNLDIFHMYVGDGVKAFDRTHKQVTYHFDANTWTLNVGGWTYTKPDAAAAPALEEPVFK
jgi:hypothetical protein